MNEPFPTPTHGDLGGGQGGENEQQNKKRERKSGA
jgi:hypothetical protein